MSERRGRDVVLLISRFDPSRDEKPQEQRYEITEGPDWSVLDAFNHIMAVKGELS